MTVDGKVVGEFIAKGSHYTLDARNLANGVYYMIIKTKEESQTIKFVKK